MGKDRLETFSDGVLAIIMTIMVLELKVPHGGDINVLKPLWPVFLSYLLSFIYIGIYWNNHHHLFHVTEYISGGVMWANLHLLFWLSLIPFVTAWMGQNRFEAAPTALYGMVLLMAAVSFWILQWAIIAKHGRESLLAHALGHNNKGKLTIVLHAIAVPAAFLSQGLAGGIYILVALLWLIPDSRIVREIEK